MNDEQKKNVLTALDMQRRFIAEQWEAGQVSSDWYNGYLTALKFAENAMGEGASSNEPPHCVDQACVLAEGHAEQHKDARGGRWDKYGTGPAYSGGANRRADGSVVYDEAGNYGSCVRCGRTLNDNVDDGDYCYGCTETLYYEQHPDEDPRRERCPVCNGELVDGKAHDHTDDSPEIPDWAMDRPRGDY